MVRAAANVNYLASGLLVPAPLAGNAALELCNTFAGWGEQGGREYLASYEHFVVWARERDLVDERTAEELLLEAPSQAREAARVLERAKRLRRAFYAVATDGADDDDRALVAREAERAAARAHLEWRSGAAVWAFPATLELPLLAAARSVGEFVTRPVACGRCPGHGCGWLFADPNGRRRWCSMAICGNRAKVRRHARRAAESRYRTDRPGRGAGERRST